MLTNNQVNQGILQRIKQETHVNENEDLDKQFAQDCSSKLGYTLIKSNVDKDIVKNKVLSILFKNNIRGPFTVDSVAQYKKKIYNTQFYTGDYIAISIMSVISLISIIGGIFVPQMFAGLLLNFFSVFYWCIGRKENLCDWHFRNLSDFKQLIPEYVLQTALDVTNLLNKEQISHKWYVECFERNPDPFLVLCYKLHNSSCSEFNESACMYLEVWDEASFKAKREF
jgi:hypothetical protein